LNIKFGLVLVTVVCQIECLPTGTHTQLSPESEAKLEAFREMLSASENTAGVPGTGSRTSGTGNGSDGPADGGDTAISDAPEGVAPATNDETNGKRPLKVPVAGDNPEPGDADNGSLTTAASDIPQPDDANTGTATVDNLEPGTSNADDGTATSDVPQPGGVDNGGETSDVPQPGSIDDGGVTGVVPQPGDVGVDDSASTGDVAQPGPDSSTQDVAVPENGMLGKLMVSIMEKLGKGEPIKMIVDIKNPEVMMTKSNNRQLK